MWNCTHFKHPTDEQLGRVDMFFSNYYNLQSVYFECKDSHSNRHIENKELITQNETKAVPVL